MEQYLNQKLLNLTFYKAALKLFELTWDDCEFLQKDRKGWPIADQIIRSCGSISANIEEGYGRESTKEFMRFLQISRASALETQGWYYRSTELLETQLVEQRIKQLVI